MKSGIYLITNTRNYKRYVGSAVKFELRWRAHLSLLDKRKHPNRHLQAAFNKYGRDAFVFEILFYWSVFPKQDLLAIETSTIAIYKVCNPEFGYNICSIAGSSLGRKHSSETKALIRFKLAGRQFSQETRSKISKATRGEKHHHYGKPLSKRVRLKISATLQGHILSLKTRIKMSISKTGNRNPNFGKHLSDETKIKISLAKSGRKNPMFGKLPWNTGKQLTEEHKLKIKTTTKATKEKNKNRRAFLVLLANRITFLAQAFEETT